MTNQRLRRDAIFGFADARGNNPHSTLETSEHEDRRLNAQRYETVQQMDQQLDARARGLAQNQQRARMPGLGLQRRPMGHLEPPPVAPTSGPSLWETLAIFAAGAGLVWLLTRKDEKDKDDEDGDIKVRTSNKRWPESMYENPTVAPAPVTVVLSNPSAPNAQPNQTVVPVVVAPPALEEPKKRKRKNKNPKIAAAHVVTVEAPIVVPSSTSTT